MQTLEMESQTSTTSKIYSSLIEMGYSLSDFGDHWRTKAIYRGGNNPTSLKIYKNTGVWQDFVAQKGPMPFKKLVELTLNTNDYSVIKKYLQNSFNEEEFKQPAQKLEMDKIYPKDCLKALFPNFSFYEKKKISIDTLKLYKVGLASAGRMYRRLVFPIYNDQGQIFGFSGRKIDEDNDSPKWKHIGKKNNWIYPACLPNFQEITDEVFLIESIGDSLALTENKIPNHLVTFGLDCSNAIINFLISKDLKRIVISTNNDSHKELNSGLLSSVKIMMKLSSFFDLDVLKIKLPFKNDFSEMHEAQMDFEEWKKSEFLPNEEIIKFINTHQQEFNREKLSKFIKKLNAQ
jgi:hypothetical protein